MYLQKILVIYHLLGHHLVELSIEPNLKDSLVTTPSHLDVEKDPPLLVLNKVQVLDSRDKPKPLSNN